MTTTRTRLLTRGAVTAAAAALLLTPAGIAAAQEDPPDVTAQLCAAATVSDANAVLGANLAVQLPAGVRDATDPAQLAGTLDSAKTLLGCAEPTDTPEPTTTPPTTTPATTTPAAPDEPFYENCAAAIEAGVAPINKANGEPGYRPELDSDSDGIACEANESDAGGGAPPTAATAPSTGSSTGGGGFSQLDQVPTRAAETGGGPA